MRTLVRCDSLRGDRAPGYSPDRVLLAFTLPLMINDGGARVAETVEDKHRRLSGRWTMPIWLAMCPVTGVLRLPDAVPLVPRR